jgi:hypothetical protein
VFNFGGLICDAVIWCFLIQSLGDVLSVCVPVRLETPHPEDGRITGRNMLMSTLSMKYIITYVNVKMTSHYGGNKFMYESGGTAPSFYNLQQ